MGLCSLSPGALSRTRCFGRKQHVFGDPVVSGCCCSHMATALCALPHSLPQPGEALPSAGPLKFPPRGCKGREGTGVPWRKWVCLSQGATRPVGEGSNLEPALWVPFGSVQESGSWVAWSPAWSLAVPRGLWVGAVTLGALCRHPPLPHTQPAVAPTNSYQAPTVCHTCARCGSPPLGWGGPCP